jgi:hypothetical protein
LSNFGASATKKSFMGSRILRRSDVDAEQMQRRNAGFFH